MSSVDQNKLQLSLGSLDHHLEDAKTAPTESVLDTSLDDAGEESDSIATQILDEASQAALKSKKTEKQQEAKVAEEIDWDLARYAQWKSEKSPWYKPIIGTKADRDNDKEWAAHKKKQEAKVAEEPDLDLARYAQWKMEQAPWYTIATFNTAKERDKDKKWAAYKKKQKKTAQLLAAILVKNAAVDNPVGTDAWIEHYRQNALNNYGKVDPTVSLGNFKALDVARGNPSQPSTPPPKPGATVSSTPVLQQSYKQQPSNTPLALSTLPKSPKL